LYISIFEAKIKDFPPIVSFGKKTKAGVLICGSEFGGFFEKRKVREKFSLVLSFLERGEN